MQDLCEVNTNTPLSANPSHHNNTLPNKQLIQIKIRFLWEIGTGIKECEKPRKA
jgi:hypothetical protein